MSAGIIHEINNPLNFATTGLFTLRNKGKYLAPEQQEEYAEILKDVEEGIKRVKTIVSDLRMFTHPDTESRDQVEVPEVVAAALRFLSNEWKDKVRIEQKLAEHQTIWANKNKLIHVLVNLLQNSLDALKAKSFESEQPTIWIEGRLEPGRSILVVRDNGTGHRGGAPGQDFRPVLHHQRRGRGHGAGPGHLLPHRAGVRRPDLGADRAGQVLRVYAGVPGQRARIDGTISQRVMHNLYDYKDLRSSTWTTRRSP